MKSFFKENFALAVGIALPLVLIVLFFAAGRISQTAIPDPQYSVVFATNYNNGAFNNPYDISVENGDIVIEIRKLKDDAQPHHQRPRLYIFDHRTLTARPVEVDFDNIEGGFVAGDALEELNKSQIDSAPLSPDGYEFDYHYRSSGGIFDGFFGFGYRHRSQYALRKGPRVIPVEGPPHTWYNAHFLGWIIE